MGVSVITSSRTFPLVSEHSRKISNFGILECVVVRRRGLDCGRDTSLATGRVDKASMLREGALRNEVQDDQWSSTRKLATLMSLSSPNCPISWQANESNFCLTQIISLRLEQRRTACECVCGNKIEPAENDRGRERQNFHPNWIVKEQRVNFCSISKEHFLDELRWPRLRV